MKTLKPIHRKPAKTGDEEEVVTIGVEQKEEKYGDNYFWQYEVSFPKTKKSKYLSFYNSLGLYSKEDWDAWLLTSKLLHLPVPSDGSQDGFEIAVIGVNNGEERVVVAGSNIRSGLMWLTDDFVKEIVEEVAAHAVDLAENKFDDGEVNEDVEELNGEVNEDGKELDKSRGDIEKGLEDSSTCIISREDGAEQVQVDSPINLVDEEGTAAVKSKSQIITCNHCGSSGFKDLWFLRRHISQMHLSSIKCDICDNVFIDKFQYLQHAKTCYFWCDQCSFHDKRKSRMEGHQRKHDREH